MSDTKGSDQSRDAAPRLVEATAPAGSSAQQSAQGRSSAATQYWQRVAATGRAAKSAKEGRQHHMPAQRPSTRVKP